MIGENVTPWTWPMAIITIEYQFQAANGVFVPIGGMLK